MQGPRGAQGPRRCATPASTWTSTAGTATRSSTRTPTTRCGSPTSSCRPWSTTPTGTCGPSTTGEIVRTIQARDLMRQIGEATWECADPGMQFDTTINRWHTAANTGRINGSNPCSEYMHLDNSACNLASLNLLTFLDDDEHVRRRGFTAAVEVVFTAQEILVGHADYPTEPIGETSRQFRQLGLGYANLGALLMALGLPYDSDEGRAWAAAITALMTGHAYATSARTAARMGPFAGYVDNDEHMLRVLDMHRAEVANIDEELVPSELLGAAQQAWDEACELAAVVGVRNSQATVLAPTGTIGLMMDCDTTGIEPDLGLCKMKKLVGGGTMTIVNQTVPRALRRLGYTRGRRSTRSSPTSTSTRRSSARRTSKLEHVPVFACSMGDNAIHYSGHVRMMAAVQPFISGAISKTVNMPEEVTVEEVEQLHIDAWQLGVKAVAIYRDNCKVAQPRRHGQEGPEAGPGRRAGDRGRPGGRAGRRDGDRQGAGAREAAADPPVQDVLVPGGRLQGLRHRRRVRRRPSRRAVPPGVQAGLDPGRHHGRVRHLGQPRPAVRRAAAGVRRDVHEHAVRAGGHDRRPRHPHRQLARRLHLPPPRRRLPQLRGAGRARHPHGRGATPAHAARRGGVGHHRCPRLGDGGRSAVHPVGQHAGRRRPVRWRRRSCRRRRGPAVLSTLDAPYCMQCGVQMQRAGSCHACPSCGTTSGCS